MSGNVECCPFCGGTAAPSEQLMLPEFAAQQGEGSIDSGKFRGLAYTFALRFANNEDKGNAALDTLIAHIDTILCARLARTAAPSEAQPIPTDLSKRLRESAKKYSTTLFAADIIAAADEIDRYSANAARYVFARDNGYFSAPLLPTDITYSRAEDIDFGIDALRAALAKKGGAA